MPDPSVLKKSFISTDHQQVYKNLLVEAVLLVVAVILVLNFLVLPKKKAVGDQRIQLAQLSEQSDAIQEKTAELSSLVSQMKAAKKDITVLDAILPLNSRITTTHVLLESLAASTGMTLTGISVDGDSRVVVAGDTKNLSSPFGEQHRLQTIKANLAVTGTMDQFVSFLKTLEGSARLIDVSALDITANKNNEASFKLTLKTYFYGPEAAVDTAASAPVQ